MSETQDTIKKVWGDGLMLLTLSSRAPVARTVAGPLVFRGSLVGEEVVRTLPA